MKSEMRALEIIRVLTVLSILSIIAMLTAALPFDAPVLTVTPDFRDVPADSGTTTFDVAIVFQIINFTTLVS